MAGEHEDIQGAQQVRDVRALAQEVDPPGQPHFSRQLPHLGFPAAAADDQGLNRVAVLEGG